MQFKCENYNRQNNDLTSKTVYRQFRLSIKERGARAQSPFLTGPQNVNVVVYTEQENIKKASHFVYPRVLILVYMYMKPMFTKAIEACIIPRNFAEFTYIYSF